MTANSQCLFIFLFLILIVDCVVSILYFRNFPAHFMSLFSNSPFPPDGVLARALLAPRVSTFWTKIFFANFYLQTHVAPETTAATTPNARPKRPQRGVFGQTVAAGATLGNQPETIPDSAKNSQTVARQEVGHRRSCRRL